MGQRRRPRSSPQILYALSALATQTPSALQIETQDFFDAMAQDFYPRGAQGARRHGGWGELISPQPLPFVAWGLTADLNPLTWRRNWRSPESVYCCRMTSAATNLSPSYLPRQTIRSPSFSLAESTVARALLVHFVEVV